MKKAADKRILTLLILLALLAAAIGVFISIKNYNSRIVTLSVYHPFEDPLWAGALKDEIREFEKLSRRFSIQVIDGNYASVQTVADSSAGSWDLIIGSSALSRNPELFAEAPLPLTGSLWGLYYNKEVLNKAGITGESSKEPLPTMFNTGSYSVQDFREVCLAVKKAGVTPISIGSQFGWPLAIWIQTFMASGETPEEAATITTEGYDSEAPGLKAAIAQFKSFLSDGLVDPSHASKDWPQSIQDVVNGKAAFCLVNEGFIGSLNPADRQKLGYLPLPASVTGNRTQWAIGSLIYIGRNAKLKDDRQSRKLLDFLTSQGTTERLSAKIGAPFFTQGKGPEKLYLSITSTSTNPVIKKIQAEIAE